MVDKMKKCTCGKMPKLVKQKIEYPVLHVEYYYHCESHPEKLPPASAIQGMQWQPRGESEFVPIGYSTMGGAETAWDECMERIGK